MRQTSQLLIFINTMKLIIFKLISAENKIEIKRLLTKALHMIHAASIPNKYLAKIRKPSEFALLLFSVLSFGSMSMPNGDETTRDAHMSPHKPNMEEKVRGEKKSSLQLAEHLEIMAT